ncbi:S8 family serine peptidase [Hymenobacter sp. B81]|uniref:S8 family serine peptidase n=1 Tax=Hymenobacter sp. B81 TaxID=3344878 RepID=UPI0037DC53CE
MKHLDALLLAALLLGSTTLPAQHRPSAPKLLLASGTVAPPDNFSLWTSAVTADRAAASELWQGHYYRVLQFESLPTAAQQRELAARGVKLLHYLPQNAYVAALPATLDRSRLRGFGIRSVLPVEARWKYSLDVAQGPAPAHARRGADQVAVVVQYHPTIGPDEAAAQLRLAGFAVGERLDYSQQVEVTLPATALARLAALPWVATLEYVAPPAEPENYRGRTAHRANVLSTDYGAGRHYDGRGVNVAHGDDGAIGPHIDYQGRFDQSSAGPNQGNHGDHVAGIIMGAGNLDPRVRGQATGAFNYYYTYPGNINSAPQHYATRAVRITTSSYGDGNNTGYTSFTRSVDMMTRQMPLLLHVFSSGNSGTANMGYGAGAGWGNITGGHKQGKNVITVGNTTYQDALSSSSSRGPAKDGRIKPDVCAVGTNVLSTVDTNTYATFSGTSMACPAVSGVLAQLMQAHKDLNGGTEAPGALLKAALMNTAEDLGNAGPDYRFGYGRVNALRAVRVLENRSYRADTIAQGQTRTHTIAVPAGQKQLRVMLYWHDVEASANAARALVNNLDLTLAAPGGASYQPWVLNPAPVAASLNALAVRGRDTLNNAEQVTLDNPAAGTYTLTVQGAAVPVGPQAYTIVYTWLDDQLEMTYPIGGETFVPGETEALRWDALPGTEPFIVEYTTDNGATWTMVHGSVAASARTFDWLVPAGLSSGRVRVRVRRGALADESDANFSISAVPQNVRVTALCRDSTTLAWNAVPGATAYTVFKLGAMYMDSVTTVTGTQAKIALPLTGEQWLAVRAVGANGLRSRRTRALQRGNQLLNCPSAPIAAIAGGPVQHCVGLPLKLNDASQGTPTSWQWTVSPATATYVGGTSATSQNPQLVFSQPGSYTISLRAANQYGQDVYTGANLVTIVAARPLPLAESFAAGIAPAGWQVQNPTGGFTWQLSPGPVMSPDGTTRRVAMVNDYEYAERGALDYLVLPPLDLTGSGNPVLEFRVAHRQYSASYVDGLRVDMSTDCGLTWTPTPYLKRGAQLASMTGFYTQAWSPTSPQHWRRDTIDLRPLFPAGLPASALFRFANLNDNGQNLYLTDVKLSRLVLGARKAVESWPFAAFPVPFGHQLTVQVQAPRAGAATLELTDALGRTLRRQSVQLTGQPQQLKLPTEALPAGLYTLHLLGADGHHQTLKLTK